jgi:hypothetical protein
MSRSLGTRSVARLFLDSSFRGSLLAIFKEPWLFPNHFVAQAHLNLEKEPNMIMEIFIAAVLIAMVVGTLFLIRGSDMTAGRNAEISRCYDNCNDDPKQIFYSCAVKCSTAA